MKRSMVAVLLIFLAMVLATSPVSGQAGKPSGPKNPIRIGGSLALTGVYAEGGKLVKAGYEFWAEDINKRGGLLGRPVSVIIYDDGGDPEKAVTYYERAITVDKADLVFGGYPAPINVALMPFVEKHKKVFVGLGGQMKSFEQGFTYSFASPPTMSAWAYIGLAGVLDDLIPKNEWPKSMAILTMNNAIGQEARANVIKTAQERGIRVVVDEAYSFPLSDATQLVSKAKATQAELFACMSLFDDGIMITRSAKAMNYNPKLFFHLAAPLTPAWAKEFGEDGNNVITPHWWNHSLPFSDNDKISEAARSRFKMSDPPILFGMGYSWMKTLELAVQGAKSLDDTKIRDYLRSHKFDLPYGKQIVFDQRGLPPAYALALQNTGGKIEVIWPKNVATTKIIYPRPAWKR